MFLKLVSITCVTMCYAQVLQALEYAFDNSTTFKFTINSYRNATGHWNAQILVGRGGEQNDETLKLDIEHITTKFAGSENLLIAANITGSPVLKPESDYELIRGLGYYKLHTEPQTWHTAEVTCYQEGGHLAIINSDFEFYIMKMLFDRHPKITDGWRNDNAFLGISDLRTPKHFVTIFGVPANDTGYINWHPGQPNYDGHCIVVQRSGLLHDVGCDYKIAFFCERKL